MSQLCSAYIKWFETQLSVAKLKIVSNCTKTTKCFDISNARKRPIFCLMLQNNIYYLMF